MSLSNFQPISFSIPYEPSAIIFSLDTSDDLVWRCGKQNGRITLDPKEIGVLKALLMKTSQRERTDEWTMTRAEILEAAWPSGTTTKERAVDVYKHRLFRDVSGPLRKGGIHIEEKQFIRVVRGTGYGLAPDICLNPQQPEIDESDTIVIEVKATEETDLHTEASDISSDTSKEPITHRRGLGSGFVNFNLGS